RRTVAFYVDERHLNGNGVAHGGMLMTFADAVLGGCAWDANGRRTCVTLSMQSNFLKPARFGDLILCRAEVVRKTRSITFVRGSFDVRGEAIFTASSLWKVVGG
ncbi:MAG: PaaI family thioesterase, partial [Alphaproteobacteria bacterium]